MDRARNNLGPDSLIYIDDCTADYAIKWRCNRLLFGATCKCGERFTRSHSTKCFSDIQTLTEPEHLKFDKDQRKILVELRGKFGEKKRSNYSYIDFLLNDQDYARFEECVKIMEAGTTRTRPELEEKEELL
jgi:hypothetical protein